MTPVSGRTTSGSAPAVDDLDALLADRVTPAYANDKFADTDAKFADPGDKFIWNLIHDQKTGMDGVAAHAGGRDAVEGLYRDWTLANLFDGKVKEANWNYRSLVLNGVDSDYVTVDQGIAYYQSNVNGNMPPTRKNVRRNTAAEPWGAYYRTFGGSEPGFTMKFTGSAQDGIAPNTGAYEWYAGLGNMLQRTLERTLTGVPAGATLSFMTWFDIEPDWDYGNVEASTDGVTWTRLTQLEQPSDRDGGPERVVGVGRPGRPHRGLRRLAAGAVQHGQLQRDRAAALPLLDR